MSISSSSTARWVGWVTGDVGAATGWATLDTGLACVNPSLVSSGTRLDASGSLRLRKSSAAPGRKHRGGFDPWRTTAAALDVLAVSHRHTWRCCCSASASGSWRCCAAQAALFWRERQRHLARRWSGLRPVSKAELMEQFDPLGWRCGDPPRPGAGLAVDPAHIGQPFAGPLHRWRARCSSGEPGLFCRTARAHGCHDASRAAPAAVAPFPRRWLDPCCYFRSRLVGATSGTLRAPVTLRRPSARSRASPSAPARTTSCSRCRRWWRRSTRNRPRCWPPCTERALLLVGEARWRLRVTLAEVWTGGRDARPGGARAEIEAAFGCPLATSYGASEFPRPSHPECARCAAPERRLGAALEAGGWPAARCRPALAARRSGSPALANQRAAAGDPLRTGRPRHAAGRPAPAARRCR